MPECTRARSGALHANRVDAESDSEFLPPNEKVFDRSEENIRAAGSQQGLQVDSAFKLLDNPIRRIYLPNRRPASRID